MDGSDHWMFHHPHAVLGKGDDNNYKEKSKKLSTQFYVSFAVLTLITPLNSALWGQRWMIEESFSCALMDSCKTDWS